MIKEAYITMDTHEQKYKEALEKLQEALAPCEDGCKISGLTRDCLENIFPELRESEDEKIRKSLIHLVHLYGGEFGMIDANTSVENAIAWLEKQGETSDQIHYWTEEEIEPIISDYLRGAEHYGGMIARLRCLKPKSDYYHTVRGREY